MNRCNLIPIRRRAAMARARRLRLWGAVAAVELLLLGTAGAAVWVEGASRGLSAGELPRAQEECERQVEAAHAAQTMLVEAEHARDTGRQFVDQPDWSLLLVSVDQALGAQGMLNHCEIAPEYAAAASASALPSGVLSGRLPTAAPPEPVMVGYAVKFSGLARSQGAVSQIVIRLEDLHLFEKVDLVQTTPASLPGRAGDGIAFQVTCRLSGAPAEVQP